MAALGTASVGGLAAFLGASAASTLVIGARRAAHTKAGSPPVAERRPATYKIGNVPGPKRGTDAAKLIDPPIERSDDLFWLRDDERKDPKVLAHVRAENAYTEFKTSHLTAPGGSVDKLYAEFRSRMKETDAGVPYRKGPFSYYSRTVQGQSYPIHCRRPATVRGGVRAVGADAAEEILLDENAVAAGHKMCDVQAVEVSPDQAALAFAVDFSGYETYSIKFQRLAWREAGRAPGAPAAAAHVGGHPVDETKGVGAAGAGVGAAGAAGSGPAAGSISSSAATFAERAPAGLPALTDEIHGTSGVVEWGADCSHCYYLTMDAEHRPHRLWRHVLGTPQADDECLFEEADERFWLHIGRTLSGDFLVVHSSSKVTGEVAVLPLTARGEAAARAAGAKPAAQLAVTPVEAGDEDGDSGSESGSEGEEDAAAAAAAAAAAKAAQAKRSAAAAAAAPAVAAPSGPRAPLPLWLPIQPRVEGVLYEIEHYRRDTVASASTGAGSKSAAAAGALPGAEDVFVILTNRDGAKNFKVAVAPVSRPSGDNWRDVLPHSRDLYITDIDVHSGFWAVSGREGGYENAWVAYAADVDAAIDAALRSTRSSAARGTGSRSSAVTLPLTRLPARDAVYVLSVGGGNEEYEAAALRFGYSSPTTPPLVCEYRLQPGATTGDATSIEAPASAGAISAPQPPAWAASGSVVAGDASAPIVVLKQKEVPNVDPTLYRTARLWATAKDGTRVPISILYRPDAHKLRPSGASAAAGAATGAKAGAGSGSSAGEECPLAQPAPMLLYAYGSYGYPMDPNFSAHALSLCDRGVVYAIAHIRGGGEMGRHWYEDEGKLLTKRNTFSDFIACADHLVGAGWTAKKRVAAQGGSAGGLLMGVIANERPDLWAAVLAEVPFVDVLATMVDSTIPLTTTEWEEWGNPNEREYYEYIASYSPVDNVRKQAYAPILLEAGLNDSRVAYWEAAKFAQRLRAANTGPAEVLLKCEMDEGHAGAMDRYKYLKEKAFSWGWVLDKLNVAV